MEKKKLKPVTFIKGNYNYYSQDDFRQRVLLKAMTVSDDPKVWMKMANLKKMADVYRTLDKLAIRKEYHEALVRKGFDLDKIVDGIKDIAENSSSDSTKLKGYQTILKSLGLDRYEKEDDKGKSWEETIIEHMDKEKKKALEEGEVKTVKADYEVVVPKAPVVEKKKRADEEEAGRSLYE